MACEIEDDRQAEITTAVIEGGLEERKEENGSGIPQAFPATTPNRKCTSSILYWERESK